ncbi:reverse transcriptase domain-containing protein [Tanacetum coccineum]
MGVLQSGIRAMVIENKTSTSPDYSRDFFSPEEISSSKDTKTLIRSPISTSPSSSEGSSSPVSEPASEEPDESDTCYLIIKEIQTRHQADQEDLQDEAQASTMANTNKNAISNYKGFMNCQPSYFNGTKSWNAYPQPIGIEQANRITWTELKRLLTNKYCPRTEIKKMEDEFYNLTVKGNDLKTYIRRFQELAILCPNMVPNYENLMEVFIGGLPRSIEGNVTALRPQTLEKPPT